jgi:hypothetical protein
MEAPLRFWGGKASRAAQDGATREGLALKAPIDVNDLLVFLRIPNPDSKVSCCYDRFSV